MILRHIFKTTRITSRLFNKTPGSFALFSGIFSKDKSKSSANPKSQQSAFDASNKKDSFFRNRDLDEADDDDDVEISQDDSDDLDEEQEALLNEVVDNEDEVDNFEDEDEEIEEEDGDPLPFVNRHLIVGMPTIEEQQINDIVQESPEKEIEQNFKDLVEDYEDNMKVSLESYEQEIQPFVQAIANTKQPTFNQKYPQAQYQYAKLSHLDILEKDHLEQILNSHPQKVKDLYKIGYFNRFFEFDLCFTIMRTIARYKQDGGFNLNILFEQVESEQYRKEYHNCILADELKKFVNRVSFEEYSKANPLKMYWFAVKINRNLSQQLVPYFIRELNKLKINGNSMLNQFSSISLFLNRRISQIILEQLLKKCQSLKELIGIWSMTMTLLLRIHKIRIGREVIPQVINFNDVLFSQNQSVDNEFFHSKLPQILYNKAPELFQIYQKALKKANNQKKEKQSSHLWETVNFNHRLTVSYVFQPDTLPLQIQFNTPSIPMSKRTQKDLENLGFFDSMTNKVTASLSKGQYSQALKYYYATLLKSDDDFKVFARLRTQARNKGFDDEESQALYVFKEIVKEASQFQDPNLYLTPSMLAHSFYNNLEYNEDLSRDASHQETEEEKDLYSLFENGELDQKYEDDEVLFDEIKMRHKDGEEEQEQDQQQDQQQMEQYQQEQEDLKVDQSHNKQKLKMKNNENENEELEQDEVQLEEMQQISDHYLELGEHDVLDPKKSNSKIGRIHNKDKQKIGNKDTIVKQKYSSFFQNYYSCLQKHIQQQKKQYQESLAFTKNNNQNHDGFDKSMLVDDNTEQKFQTRNIKREKRKKSFFQSNEKQSKQSTEEKKHEKFYSDIPNFNETQNSKSAEENKKEKYFSKKKSFSKSNERSNNESTEENKKGLFYSDTPNFNETQNSKTAEENKKEKYFSKKKSFSKSNERSNNESTEENKKGLFSSNKQNKNKFCTIKNDDKYNDKQGQNEPNDHYAEYLRVKKSIQEEVSVKEQQILKQKETFSFNLSSRIKEQTTQEVLLFDFKKCSTLQEVDEIFLKGYQKLNKDNIENVCLKYQKIPVVGSFNALIKSYFLKKQGPLLNRGDLTMSFNSSLGAIEKDYGEYIANAHFDFALPASLYLEMLRQQKQNFVRKHFKRICAHILRHIQNMPDELIMTICKICSDQKIGVTLLEIMFLINKKKLTLSKKGLRIISSSVQKYKNMESDLVQFFKDYGKHSQILLQTSLFEQYLANLTYSEEYEKLLEFLQVLKVELKVKEYQVNKAMSAAQNIEAEKKHKINEENRFNGETLMMLKIVGQNFRLRTKIPDFIPEMYQLYLSRKKTPTTSVDLGVGLLVNVQNQEQLLQVLVNIRENPDQNNQYVLYCAMKSLGKFCRQLKPHIEKILNIVVYSRKAQLSDEDMKNLGYVFKTVDMSNIFSEYLQYLLKTQIPQNVEIKNLYYKVFNAGLDDYSKNQISGLLDYLFNPKREKDREEYQKVKLQEEKKATLLKQMSESKGSEQNQMQVEGNSVKQDEKLSKKQKKKMGKQVKKPAENIKKSFANSQFSFSSKLSANHLRNKTLRIFISTFMKKYQPQQEGEDQKGKKGKNKGKQDSKKK